MTITDIQQKLIPGSTFKFSPHPNSVTNLQVVSNDGYTLVANVLGGPRNAQQMIFSLEGLEKINEISQ